jgi:PP-loop superfamily ATP-utilizing enzyme
MRTSTLPSASERSRGITKQNIRNIARDYGLIAGEKPSEAFVSSRVPYGKGITGKNSLQLKMPDSSDRRGFQQFRVCLLDTIVRKEVREEDTEKILNIQPALVKKIQVDQNYLFNA